MVHIQVPFMHITQEVLFTHANMPSIHETPVQFFQRLILPAEMFIIIEINDKRLMLVGDIQPSTDPNAEQAQGYL